MRKVILLSIILIVCILMLTSVLVECKPFSPDDWGLFSLDGWIVPDDSEFTKLIKELDTPRKISNYMIKNFSYEYHDYYAPDPYSCWKNKKVDCNDMATFGMFIAKCHHYRTYMIIIIYKDKDILVTHAIAVYVEDDGLSYTGKTIYYNNDNCWFNTFREIVEYDSKNVTLLEWKKYIIYDFKYNIIQGLR